MTSEKRLIVKGEKIRICVCLSCGWIYCSDAPVECENPRCPRYGKRGKMCDVLEPAYLPSSLRTASADTPAFCTAWRSRSSLTPSSFVQ